MATKANDPSAVALQNRRTSFALREGGGLQMVGCRTFVIGCCAVVVAFLPIGDRLALAQAGSVAGSVERSIARRLAQRGETAVLSAAERAALAKVWRELDQTTLAAIERRYGGYIVKSRLDTAVATRTQITDRAAFDRHLRNVNPTMSENERQVILGYYFDQRLYVNGNQVQVPLTVAHERLHQLADPRFREVMGRGLDEGVTEQFAKHIHSDLGLADSPSVYPREQRVVEMLLARVPEERLARAYFQGEMAPLRDILDADLGAGTFKRFTMASKAGNLAAAEALLRAPVAAR